MKNKELKLGTFRWRKKFRYLPTREKLIDAIGIEWLANRLYSIIYKHSQPGEELQMIRIKQFEFIYIVQITMFYTCIEIIQKNPINYETMVQCI